MWKPCLNEHSRETLPLVLSQLYLDLLQLFLVGGVHLLQPLLQLPVSLQKAFPELGSQLQVCRRDGVKNHRCFSAHSSASLMHTWALCNQLCELLGLLEEIQQPTFKFAHFT